MSLDILVIETFCYCPHLETAGEIAIEAAKDGLKVGFIFIDVDNLDDYWPRSGLIIKTDRLNRVKKMINILNTFRIKTSIINGHTYAEDFKSNLSCIISVVQKCTNLDSIKEIKFDNFNIGKAILNSYISLMRDSEPQINKDILIRYLISGICVYKISEEIIQDVHPDRVVTYNGRFVCSKGIVDACRKYSVPILYHERGATKERYYLSEISPHNIKAIRNHIKNTWLNLEDKEKFKIAESYFLRKIKGEEIGWVSFTANQIKDFIPKKTKKYRWTYYTSSDDEYLFLDNFIDSYIFESQISAVKFLINYVSKIENVELVIRVHPHKEKKSKRLRDFWNSLSGKNVLVIPSYSRIDSYALAKSSDLIIVYNSTMGVEASYMGKPVILLGESVYRGLDCVYEPLTEEELISILCENSLLPKPKGNCLPFGYYYSVFGNKYINYTPIDFFDGKFLGKKLDYSGLFFDFNFIFRRF